MEFVDSCSHLPSHSRYHISVVPEYSLSPIIPYSERTRREEEWPQTVTFPTTVAGDTINES
ncbi:hypothetical protein QC762_200495 [Podospora pseudocomata]|uniref:Uncharacterized protein n=1 Tax=Podospora pseudocomata TaxID=2093779 RepID=A0ABR0GPM8_9PEZI|nr:hypothetical protein QC762_200495 [Podospora pseudocomata]